MNSEDTQTNIERLEKAISLLWGNRDHLPTRSIRRYRQAGILIRESLSEITSAMEAIEDTYKKKG